MPASSSPDGVPIARGRWRWPIDRLTVDVAVVRPRHLTALEWAIEACLDRFDGRYLDESVEMLGLGDRVFVDATLEELRTLGAVEPVEDDPEVDWLLTRRGRELFARGEVDARPASHRLWLTVDALTDQVSAVVFEEPQTGKLAEADPEGESQPIIESEAFDRRETIGLDLLRREASAAGAPFLDRHARIERVLDVATRSLSQMLDITWHLDGSHLRYAVKTSPERSAWIERNMAQLAQRAMLDTSVRRRWDRSEGYATAQLVAPMAPDGARRAVIAALASARRVTLHALWRGIPGIAEALKSAVRRGARVIERAKQDELRDWHEAGDESGFDMAVATPDGDLSSWPGAIIVDGQGWGLEHVEALTADATLLPVEVVGRLQAPGAVEAALTQAHGPVLMADALAQPLASIASEIDDPAVRAARVLAHPAVRRARIALARGDVTASAFRAWLSTGVDGPARVVVEGRLGFDPTDAWHAAAERALKGTWGQAQPTLAALGRVAVGPKGAWQVDGGAFTERAVRQWAHSGEPLTVFARRSRIATRLEPACPGGVWPRVGQGLAPLDHNANKATSEAGVALHEGFAPAAEAARWAAASCSDAPPEFDHLRSWLDARRPLRPLAESQMLAAAQVAWRAAAARWPSDAPLDAPCQVGSGLFEADDVIEAILDGDEPVELARRASQLIEAMRRRWRQTVVERAIVQRLLALWPTPGGAAVPQWIEAVRLTRIGAAVNASGAWLEAASDAVPDPGDGPGLIAWLEAAPLHRAANERRFSGRAHEHAVALAEPLRALRAEEPEVFIALWTAWHAAGLDTDRLERALDAGLGGGSPSEAPEAATGSSTKAERRQARKAKKKSKRRPK